MTAKGRATRQRIIDGAAAEIRDRGVGITLHDVMARTSTSKSQLFHYLPDGKDELMLAVVDCYRRQGRQCPLSVVMSEISRTTPGSEAVSAQLIRQWRKLIAAGIRAMQDRDKIARNIGANRAAAALLAGIQSGVSAPLSTGDLSYLEAAIDTGISNHQR